MDQTRDHLHQAHEHQRQAGAAFADHVVGADATAHLRQAARSMLQAGLAALDRADRRAGGVPATPVQPVPPVTT